MNTATSEAHFAVLAALVSARFGSEEAAIEAMKRMMQNDGWDNTEGRIMWREYVARGRAFLRASGLPVTPSQSLAKADR